MSAEVRKGYKQTEVGVIPEDWEVESLGDLIHHIYGGGTPSRSRKDFWNGDIAWATVKDMTRFDPHSTQEFTTKNGVKMSAANMVKAGQLIVSVRMAIAVARKFSIDVAINQDLKAIIFKDNTDSNFIKIFFDSNQKNIEDQCGGSTVKGLSIIQLKALALPLPPLPEQRAIATALADVDALLASLNDLLTKKRQLKQAAMQELLTGKTRLAGFTGEWEQKQVGEMGQVVTGGTPSTQSREFWGDEYPWITPTDISKKKNIFSSERGLSQSGLNNLRSLPANSVLVTCIASIGKNAILRVMGACNQQINAILPNENSDSDFLYYLFEYNKPRLISSAGTTATSA